MDDKPLPTPKKIPALIPTNLVPTHCNLLTQRNFLHKFRVIRSQNPVPGAKGLLIGKKPINRSGRKTPPVHACATAPSAPMNSARLPSISAIFLRIIRTMDSRFLRFMSIAPRRDSRLVVTMPLYFEENPGIRRERVECDILQPGVWFVMFSRVVLC